MVLVSCTIPLALLVAQFTVATPIPAADGATAPNEAGYSTQGLDSTEGISYTDGVKVGDGATAEGEEDLSKFGYQGSNGPSLWPGFCRDVNPGQSPIDIRPGSADLNAGALPVTLSPQNNATVKNNGHGIAITLSPDASPSFFVPVGQPNGAQAKYQLTGFHFHTPSEHHIQGKYFDAEMHLVHKSDDGGLAVVGVLFEIGSESNDTGVMEAIESAIPKLQGENPVPLPPFSFDSLIKNTNNFTEFHTYTGSLTTPPCSPNVLWHVINKPHPMTVQQALALRNAQGFTARLVQVAKDELPVFASAPGSLTKVTSAIGNAVTHMKDALETMADADKNAVV